MTVRKFWLENQDGAIWHFTDEESNTFLNEPTGLGFATNYGGYRLGNAEVISFMRYEIGSVNGTLKFFGKDRAEVYKNYFDFNSFIANNTLLKLHYSTPNSFESYYCYCFVQQLDKDEIDRRNCVLNCQVSFKMQSFWRNDEKQSLLVGNDILQGIKSYPLHRSYEYGTSKLSSISMINKGNIESPLKITINGRVTNPLFKIFTNNGVEYGAMKLIGTFDKVTVDADDLNEYIQLEKDGAILTAPFSYQDLTVGNPQQTYVTFLKLRSGESKAVFTYDGSFDGDVLLEWSDNYVTV